MNLNIKTSITHLNQSVNCTSINFADIHWLLRMQSCPYFCPFLWCLETPFSGPIFLHANALFYSPSLHAQSRIIVIGKINSDIRHQSEPVWLHMNAIPLELSCVNEREGREEAGNMNMAARITGIEQIKCLILDLGKTVSVRVEKVDNPPFLTVPSCHCSLPPSPGCFLPSPQPVRLKSSQVTQISRFSKPSMYKDLALKIYMKL